MFEDLTRSAPIFVLSVVVATVRVVLAGKRSVAVALASWTTAILMGWTAGYIADGFDLEQGAVRAIVAAAALTGDHLVVGLIDLAKSFREEPEQTLRRWWHAFRKGSK